MRLKEKAGRATAASIAALMVVTQLLVAPLVPAAACDYVTNKNVDLLAHLGGSGINRIVASGSLVYAATAAGLDVYDVSNDAAPTKLGSIGLGGSASDVFVAGNVAYVSGKFTNDASMKVVNVANPASPQLLGKTGNWGETYGVVVSGTYAYLSIGHAVKKIDVSDPTNPWLYQATEAPAGGAFYRLALAGDMVYAVFGGSATSANMIKAIDISNPGATPPIVGSFTTPTGAYVWDVTAAGTKVYAGETGRVEAVDFGTPGTPTALGHANIGVAAEDLTISGTTLFAATSGSGMQILDASGGATPTVVGNFAMDPCDAVAANGTKAYAANASMFKVVDVSAPASPAELGSYTLPLRDVRDVWSDGNYAYVAAGSEGLLTIDVSSETTPVLGGANLVGGDVSSVIGTAGTLFAADGSDFKSFSLASPEAPSQVGTLTMPAKIEAMFLFGDVALVACGESGVKFVNVSDPADPTVVGTYDRHSANFVHALPADEPPFVARYASSVYAEGGYAYVGYCDPAQMGDGSGLVDVVGISSMATPAKAASITTYGYPLTIAGGAGNLYIGTTYKMIAYDNSEPATDKWPQHYDVYGFDVNSIRADGTNLFLGTEKGFYVEDASDPAAMMRVGNYGDTDINAKRIFMVGDTVYVAGGDTGFYILRSLVVRQSGPTRFDTAVDLSRSKFPTATTVVLTTGYNYADAVCGAPLAHALNAPMLLVTPTGVPTAVMDEIKRLGATDAVILGGPSAVSDNVRDQLVSDAGLAGDHVTRVSGENRFETAAAIADKLAEIKGDPSTVFIATGDNFPDALTASGVAADMDSPVLLVHKYPPVPQATLDTLAAFSPADVIVVGGEPAVSADVYTAVGGTQRLFGPTRYETAAAVAQFAIGKGFTPARLIITTGLNFPDALVAGVVSAKDGNPVLLTNSGVPSGTNNFVYEHKADIKALTIVGSAKVVPNEVTAGILTTIFE